MSELAAQPTHEIHILGQRVATRQKFAKASPLAGSCRDATEAIEPTASKSATRVIELAVQRS